MYPPSLLEDFQEFFTNSKSPFREKEMRVERGTLMILGAKRVSPHPVFGGYFCIRDRTLGYCNFIYKHTVASAVDNKFSISLTMFPIWNEDR